MKTDLSSKLAPTPSGDPHEIAAPIDFAARASLGFPVVGIGGSAGSLQALQHFFSAVPPAGGMAYVVIQHPPADPARLLAEIIGRCTAMKVHQIEDGMAVESDRVYTIGSDRAVTLAQGRLWIGDSFEKRGPLDNFFRSLARDQKERAIAVVLSGMGTSGAAGAQAVKAAGGLCVVQDPDEAEFPGMPRSLIQAGYADEVLPAAEVPALLQRFARHPYLEIESKGHLRAGEALEHRRRELLDVITLVRSRTGLDFSAYKPATVLRRIQRRMGLVGAEDLDVYRVYVTEHGDEAGLLANDLMINVTGFFRDPEAWDAFRMAVIRPMVEERSVTEPLRAWVPACASGEEAYSLAILIAEEADRVGKKLDVKIFATDTAEKALALARAGVYPAGIAADFSPDRLDRCFERDDHTYRVKKDIRQQVVFAPQDVLRDPPFSRVDIITCRNLLIYLSPDAQRRALSLMNFALSEGGHLLLGNAETLGQAEGLFEVVSKRWRIYRRTGPNHHRFGDLATLRWPALGPLPGTGAMAPLARASSAVSIQTALLDEFGPPTAVVDANARLLYFHGNAEPFLTHPSGEPTQSLPELIRLPLRAAVRTVLRQTISERRPAMIDQTLPGETPWAVRITAAPLRASRSPSCFRVTFEVPSTAPFALVRPAAVADASADDALEEEVRALRRELQTSVEAFEATNQELRASHEEVISINEELQNTNEELESGREELESLNEELAAVNTQLQAKLFELESLSGDLVNLLSSTDIAVVFLDTQLNVRRFTPAIRDLLTLIPADIGRPIAHLAPKFTEEGNLIEDAEQVLRHITPRDAEVRSDSGRWYLRRTLPYRTEARRVTGIVITFIDITVRKAAEQSIVAAQARLDAAIEQMPAAVLMTEARSGTLLLANRLAAALFDQPFPLPYVGRHWTSTYASLRGIHADGRPYESADSPLARTLATGAAVVDEELDFIRPDGSRGRLCMSTASVRNGEDEPVAVVAVFREMRSA
jgi:two-component system CheB/CheR fusion protein